MVKIKTQHTKPHRNLPWAEVGFDLSFWCQRGPPARLQSQNQVCNIPTQGTGPEGNTSEPDMERRVGGGGGQGVSGQQPPYSHRTLKAKQQSNHQSLSNDISRSPPNSPHAKDFLSVFYQVNIGVIHVGLWGSPSLQDLYPCTGLTPNSKCQHYCFLLVPDIFCLFVWGLKSSSWLCT